MKWMVLTGKWCRATQVALSGERKKRYAASTCDKKNERPGCLRRNASWNTWTEKCRFDRPDREGANKQEGGSHKLIKTIKASHRCLTAKCLFSLFVLHYFIITELTMLTATQQCDGETYLGIVGYVMLGQCLRGVHP